MARRSGYRLSQALWTALLIGLGSLGCTAQVSFLTSPPKTPTPEPTAGAATPSSAAAEPTAATTPSIPSIAAALNVAPTPGSGAAATTPSTPAPAPTPTPTPTPAMLAQNAAAKDADLPLRMAVHCPTTDSRPPQLIQSAYLVVDKPATTPDKSASTPAPKPAPVDMPANLPEVTGTGTGAEPEAAPHLPTPNEKQRTFLPAYIIEPPDVLIIDGVRLIPRPPYRIEPLDVLVINVPTALPDAPIAGPYTVTPEGTVNLGFGYGSFHVVGQTLEQAAAAIKAGLRLNNPQVNVALAQFRGVQMVRGEHIVGQDGTITLGTYGCVNVTGLTVSQAKCEIERHLSRWLQDPIVSVSVGGYNSKVYYVITDGAGFGQQVYRFPITGNETVLDAISLINGLPPVASRRHIWLARPTPAQHGCYEILPVDWLSITQAGSTETNWQIFPGDRVYVKADPWITLDNQLSKFLSPIERLMGATLLGTATVNSFRTTSGTGNGAAIGGF